MAKIDKEKLAFEVEKYVFLYDKTHPNYKNRNASDEAWAAIASELKLEGNLIVLHSLCKYINHRTGISIFADKPARGQSSRGLVNSRTSQVCDKL